MPDLEALKLKISSDSQQASKGIRELSAALTELKTSAKGSTSGLATTAKKLSELNSALNGVSSGNATKLKNLAEGLKHLSDVGKIGITATTVKNIAGLSEAVKGFEGADVAGFAGQMKEVSGALKDLSAASTTSVKSVNQLAGKTKYAAANMREMKSSSSLAAMGLGMLKSGIGKTILYFGGLYGISRKVWQLFSEGFRNVSSYIENINLFNVAMGEGAVAAGEFAEKVQLAMGIDAGEWMRNQGVFQSLVTGFGVSADAASKMSKNLTQLGYDLASFYNLSTSDALQKIQSGISGELEPLRRLGFDLSYARLQQIAYNNGINQSVQEMSQAEKSQLRYIAIMTQVTHAQGDMARTIYQPANAMRVLRQQVSLLSRAFGAMLIPAMQRLLPVAVTVVQGLVKVFSAIARLFGYKPPKLDVKNYAAAAGAAGKAAESTGDLGKAAKGAGKKVRGLSKALKKYSRQLLGFDKINNLTTNKKTKSPRGGGGGGGGGVGGGGIGGGGGFDLDLPEYDFLRGITDAFGKKHPKIKAFFDWLAKHIRDVGQILTSVLGAALLTKIVKKIASVLGKTLGKKSLFGIFLTAAGAIEAFRTQLNILKEGLTKGNLIKLLGSLGTAVAGLFLAFGTKGGGIGLVISGIVLFANGIVDAYKKGFNKKNLVAIGAGIGAFAAGLQLLIGGVAGLVAFGVGAAVVAAIMIFKHRKEIAKFFKKLWAGIKSKAAEIWPKAKKIGLDLLKGYIYYLTHPWAFIKKAASILFKMVVKGIKAIFGIHSPSKKMKPLGKDMLLGIIKGFLDAIKDGVKDIGSKLLKGLKDALTDLPEKLAETLKSVPDEVKKVFSGASSAVSDLLVSVKLTAGGWAEGAKSAWDAFKDKVSGTNKLAELKNGGWMDGAYDAWTSFKGKVSGVFKLAELKNGGWFSGAKAAWDSFKEKVKGTAKLVEMKSGGWMAGAKAKWDRFKAGLKGKTVTVTAKIKWLLDSLTAVGKSVARKLGFYAMGGFPTTGEVFVAREAGPEMVGTMGRHTAVANNDQIIAGIARGVAAANATSNALLREIAAAVSSGGNQTVVLQVDSTRLGEASIRSINKVQRQQGRVLLNV